MSERILVQICPYCSSTISNATIDEFALCWHCGSVSIIDVDCGLRKPTVEEQIQLANNSELLELITEIRKHL